MMAARYASLAPFSCAAASFYFFIEGGFMAMPISGTVVGGRGPRASAPRRFSRVAVDVTAASAPLSPLLGVSELIRASSDLRAYVAGG
jgi:hypothetical protein